MTHEPLTRRQRGLARFAAALSLVAVGCVALSMPTLDAQDAATEPRASANATTPAERGAIEDAARVGRAFASLAARVSPSVVSIRVEARVDAASLGLPSGLFSGMPGDGEQIVQGGASGFLITDDGAIVTNGHVVEHATRIRVRLQDGRELPADLVGIDHATDLAVIRVAARGLTPLRLADPEQQQVGQWVVAIGSPFGLDTTVTAGVLSAKGRGGLGINEIEDFVQTDASINPGNSGGPLVNLDGEVVGVNSVIVGRGQGIGFAIPSDIVQTVSSQLLAHGRVRRAWIGVGFQELTSELASEIGLGERRGALVSEVVEGGPAANAGIEPGDVVISIDGTPVRESRELMREVLRRSIGSDVRLEILRGGRTRDVRVTTGERPETSEPEEAPPPQHREEAGFGAAWLALTPDIARQLGHQGTNGVVVAQVIPGSPADRAGLRRGDIVVDADSHVVRSPSDVERELADGHALLRVERGSHAFFAVVQRE
jgi:serine protease Do